MHEYSIIQALVDSVETHANGATVVRLRVSIGELAGVDPGLLASAYEIFRGETICSDASLEIVNVPAKWTCMTCGRVIARGKALQCDGEVKLTSGDEIVLEQIELIGSD
jgi:hydrogenase nickel incorporation protein HypA/HybF